MKKLIFAVAGGALLVSTAAPAAPTATDTALPQWAPHRLADSNLPISVDPQNAQACLTLYASRFFTVTPYPLADGTAINIGIKGGALDFLGIQIRDHSLTVLYRHPWSAKRAQKYIRKAGKVCFAADVKTWPDPAP